MINTSVRMIIYELVSGLRYAERTLLLARTETERERWTKAVQNYREAIRAQRGFESGN
jgi:hypothetical protein